MTITHLGAKRLQGTKLDRVNDSLGSSADGTNTGITLIDINGYANFDGTDDKIDLNDKFATLSNTNGGSISLWVKPTTWASEQTLLDSTNRSWSNNGINIVETGSGKVACDVYAGSGNYSAIRGAGITLTTGVWHHIVATFDGSDTKELKLYIDGVRETSYTGGYNGSWVGSGSPASTPTDNLTLGTPSGDSTSPDYNGAMKQVLIYSDVLSASEVTTLYNSGTPVTSPSTSNLVSKYDLISNANDSQGSDNGTISGNVTFTDDAYKLGTGAYSYDGSNDYVQIGSSATDFKFFSDNSSAYSLCFWLKPDQTSSDVMLFNNNASTNTNVGIQLMQLGANIRMRVGGDSSGDVWTMTESSAVTTGEWSHWALTWDKTTARMYKNGVEVETATKISGRSFSTSNPQNTGLRIGADSNSGSSNYDGVMDDIGIYKRKLTATEIGKLYNNNGGYQGTLTNGSGFTISGNTATRSSSSANSYCYGATSLNIGSYIVYKINGSTVYTSTNVNSGTVYPYVSSYDNGNICKLTATKSGSTTTLTWTFTEGSNGTLNGLGCGVHTGTSAPTSDPANWESLYAQFVLDGHSNNVKIKEGGTMRDSDTGVGYTAGMTFSMEFTDSSSAVTDTSAQLVSSLTNKSELKANYTMDSTSLGATKTAPSSGVLPTGSSTTGWTLAGTTISSNNLNFDAAKQSTENSGVYELSEALSDEKWVLRFKYTISNLTNVNASNINAFIGLFSTTGTFNTNQDYMGLSYISAANSNYFWAGARNDAGIDESSSSNRIYDGSVSALSLIHI